MSISELFTAEEKALFEYGTYSPEDNKLRMYTVDREERLEPELFAKLKAAGFRRAYKQMLWYNARYTPSKFDFVNELCGDVLFEEQSQLERAADRAERFSQYRDNARGDANSRADNLDNAPSVIGSSNQCKAEKQAAKLQRSINMTVSIWEKAEYWRDRTAGVIAHAIYKENPKARKRRIKEQEKEIRACNREIKLRHKFIAQLEAAALDHDKVKAVFNSGEVHLSRCFTLAEFPRDKPVSQYEGSMGFWSALDHGIITAEWASTRGIKVFNNTIRSYERWLTHHTLRKEYMLQMLGEQGEAMAEGWEKGGSVIFRGNRRTILKVNKGASGGVSSVDLDKNGTTIWCKGESCTNYEAPTEAGKKAVKKSKVTKPKAPALINRAGHFEMTQKAFSARKNSYSEMCRIKKHDIDGVIYRLREYFQSAPDGTFSGDWLEVTLTDKKIKDVEPVKADELPQDKDSKRLHILRARNEYLEKPGNYKRVEYANNVAEIAALIEKIGKQQAETSAPVETPESVS